MDKKQNIQSIIDHPIYAQVMVGVERTNGILGELLEEKLISEEKYDDLLHRELTMNTVKEILDLIS